jgi:hypothetical protein
MAKLAWTAHLKDRQGRWSRLISDAETFDDRSAPASAVRHGILPQKRLKHADPNLYNTISCTGWIQTCGLPRAWAKSPPSKYWLWSRHAAEMRQSDMSQPIS